jgi:iron complex outermembrane receptor protein
MVTGLSGVAALVLALPTQSSAAIAPADLTASMIEARVIRVTSPAPDVDETLDFAIAEQPLDEALASS